MRAARAAERTTHINIHNSNGFQIGDHNVQNVVATLESLVKEINNADASNEDKANAKARLLKFIEYPLVTSILGGAAGGIVAGLFK